MRFKQPREVRLHGFLPAYDTSVHNKVTNAIILGSRQMFTVTYDETRFQQVLWLLLVDVLSGFDSS